MPDRNAELESLRATLTQIDKIQTGNDLGLGSRKANLTLKEIKDKIQNAPPFQSNDIKQYYVGLPIDWQTRLSSIEKTDDGNLDVSLAIDSEDGRFVGICSCVVPLAKYPELKVLHNGHQIRITGRVAQMREAEIAYIEDAVLFY